MSPLGLIHHRSVVLHVETITSYLPSPEVGDGVVQGISHGGNPNGIHEGDLAALDEQNEVQRLDGLQRKVAWAAEDPIQEGADDSSTLLGERKPDGTFALLGRQYEGRPTVVPDDVPLVRTSHSSTVPFTNFCGLQAPSVATTQMTQGTQLIDEIQSSTPPRTRAAALVPSSVESSPPSEADEDFGMQKLALSADPPQEMSQVLGKAVSL